MESYSKAIYNTPPHPSSEYYRLDNTQKDMCKAIEENRLADLKELFDKSKGYSRGDSFTCPGPFLNVHFEIAAFHGHLECLMYLYITSIKWYDGCNWNAATCSSAAAKGHINCLKFAYKNGCPISEYAFENAVEYGQIECLRYLFKINEYCHNIEDQKIMYAKAAKYGHIKCIELLHEEEMCWDQQTCVCAAECALKYNQVECLSMLMKMDAHIQKN